MKYAIFWKINSKLNHLRVMKIIAMLVSALALSSASPGLAAQQISLSARVE
jgi:hypothetical protein